MRRLSIGSIPLPCMYVVKSDDRNDIDTCKRTGIPYIIWDYEYELLVKLVLLPTLKRMFPHIKWEQVLDIPAWTSGTFLHVTDGPKQYLDYEELPEGHSDMTYQDVYDYQHDVVESGDEVSIDTELAADYNGTRIIDGKTVLPNTDGKREESKVDLDKYVGDLSAYVDLAEIQKLGFLPSWVGEIHDIVRKNIDDYIYHEGWNKKLGWCAGNFDSSDNAPNLIIIDVSASIPFGVAATMLSLAATLREQVNADMIITGETSGWYPLNEQLPIPQVLRARHGRSNEYEMFNEILKEKVLGREWGNVIAFGDDDSPARMMFWRRSNSTSGSCETQMIKYVRAQGITKVHNLYSYHTHHMVPGCERVVGYARWVKDVCPDVTVHHNSSWVGTLDGR